MILGADIAFDKTGNIYFSGSFYDSGYFDSYTILSGQSNDLFLAKLGTGKTGIDEPKIAVSNNIIIYPNPSSGQIHICFTAPDEREEINLYDMSGNLVNTQDAANSKEVLLNTQLLPPGIYICKVISYLQGMDAPSVFNKLIIIQ